MSIQINGKNIEQEILTGLTIGSELDIQNSKILIEITDDDKEWKMEYPAKGVDKNSGRKFGDIVYKNIKINRDEVEDPVGEEFIHYMVEKTTKKEGRIFNKEEKKELFYEIDISLMDMVDNIFQTVDM